MMLSDRTLATTLRIVGILGSVIFAALLTITFVSTEKIESSAKGFIKKQIELEVVAKQQAVANSSMAQAATQIVDRLGLERETIEANLKNQLPEKIASVIASMCGYDCEKKKAVAASITEGYLERIKHIQVAENTLQDLIKGKYLEIVSNLKLDLRIFFGSNLAMFLVLLLISLFKPQAQRHLFVPGILLLAATLISSAIYLFGQDWFYTIVYNDYMGFGYLAYITGIFVLLLDISLNEARITTYIFNNIASALGSALSVAPC